MSIGYVDPVTKKYIKKAGDLNVQNTPIATTHEAGLCSPEQVSRIENSYTVNDIASRELIDAIFNK